MKQLTEEQIKNISRLPIDEIVNLTKNYNIPEWIIRKYPNKFNWSLISQYQKLSDGFIRENSELVN